MQSPALLALPVKSISFYFIHWRDPYSPFQYEILSEPKVPVQRHTEKTSSVSAVQVKLVELNISKLVVAVQQGATNSAPPHLHTFSGNGSLFPAVYVSALCACVCAYDSLAAKWILVATTAYIINCLSLGFRICVVLSICGPQRESEGRKERWEWQKWRVSVCTRFLCISGNRRVSFSQSHSKASLWNIKTLTPNLWHRPKPSRFRA